MATTIITPIIDMDIIIMIFIIIVNILLSPIYDEYFNTLHYHDYINDDSHYYQYYYCRYHTIKVTLVNKLKVIIMFRILIQYHNFPNIVMFLIVTL